MRTFEVLSRQKDNSFIKTKVNFTEDDVFASIPETESILLPYLLNAMYPGVYGDDWVKIRRHLQKAILVLEENGKIEYVRGGGSGRFNDGFVRKIK